MENPEIRQQMVARERFAPDADDVRATLLAGRGRPMSVRADRRRTRLLAGAAAGVVILIVATVGIVHSLQPVPQVSSGPAPVVISSAAPATPGWVGIDWDLISVAKEGPAMEVPIGVDSLLQFEQNGDIAGGGRCYGSMGRWTSVAGVLRVGPVLARGHSCPAVLDSGPDRNYQFAQSAIQSLATVGAVGTQVNQQTLTLQSGAYQLTYRNAGRTVIAPSSSDAPFPSAKPLTAETTTRPTQAQNPAATTAIDGGPVQQGIVSASVYDPKGDGGKDNANLAPLAIDGNQRTVWSTLLYGEQFPSSVKPGVGLMLEFGKALTPSSVTVSSDSPGTVIEIRSATAPDLPYDTTTALARGTIPSGTADRPGTVTIPLAGAPRSRYLVVFLVHLGADGSNLRSDINEISVLGH